jgi:GNAT superfamily N-acetyltransferase
MPSSDQQSMKNRRSEEQDRKVGQTYSLLRQIGKLIPPFIFRAKALYVLWLPRNRWNPQVDRSGLRWATDEDVEQLDNLDHQPPAAKFRFEKGCRAAIREEKGQLIGCIWFEPVASACDGWLQIQLRNSDLWISDVYVSPDHRGKGIANQMGDFARAELVTSGITNLVTVTNTLNYPAIRSSKKAKYEATRIWYARLFGLTFVRLPREWRIGWWGLGRSLQVPLSELKNVSTT